MKKYFLAILSIFSFCALSAQEPLENALFLKQNSPKTYTDIKSFAEDKWDDSNNMIVHEISKQANSAMYFSKVFETIDGEVFYAAIKRGTENGLTDWSKVEYEYKKQFKASLDMGGTESNVSNPNINVNSQKRTHREDFGLIGNVKTIKETSYIEVEKFGEIIKEKDRKEKYLEKDFYYIFNKNGYTTKEYKYESDGSLYSEFKYKFNSKGQVKLCKGTANLMSFLPPTDYYCFFEYDSNGNTIQESLYQSSELNLIYRYTYEYDIDNHQIEGKYYKSDGNLESESKYKYNDKGNKIERNHFKLNGKLESKTKYKYDNQGNLTDRHRYKPDGSITNQDAFKYDTYGNIIEGGGYTYKYEYDENCNWILKFEFSDHVKGHIVEREIEYFQ